MKQRGQCGFTLVEIIIVVVLLGIMAAIAIPKVVGPNERVRASEAMHILAVLLGAQKNYSLENNGAYAANINSVDVTFPASQNFAAPTVANNAAALASIARQGGPVYTLSIDDTGVITCAGAGCAEASCTKGGGGNQCN
jgi:type IV pilus assembly protein PilA